MITHGGRARARQGEPGFAPNKDGELYGEGAVPLPEDIMIILGVILLIIGLLAGIGILWTIGIILVAIGVVLWILGAVGHAVGGRRHYW
ncbi:hypothetical protein J7E87_06130 [Streptomyces sp. ISL-1]|nr:hypothetical protein [Streptomyces sp. ISL-1]